ncbi:hypothetical protein PoB_007421000 [Plakobranchus ocellatus]|uniref:Uncharacterized protein n=1 Tax=Plakobranchus ocellatus TaxID=259542 RepID=A0AAV4DUR1_9GAST|nr:hypothetical protein PoB_007421000 [Plakobranchus ocellatus]
MRTLEWSIDKWLMQGLLTSILTGVGFLVISLTIEYVKRFRKGRQAREQEIFLQRILCGEQVLEWCNGTVRAREKRDGVLGTGRSLPRGQRLFEQYKRAGGFLGVGQGYYSSLAEARRLLDENLLQDRSMSAVVSKASWCGGPGSRVIVAASSTSVDDELTSLEWDTGLTFATYLPSYLSPTSCSVKSDKKSKKQSGSNCNNMITKSPNTNSCADQYSNIRLWSTQCQKSFSGEGDMELGVDLCARTLREHPHLAPFLRKDVLKAAQAIESEEAGTAKQAEKKVFKRSMEKQTKPPRENSNKAYDRDAGSKASNLKETSLVMDFKHDDLGESGEKAAKDEDIQYETSPNTGIPERTDGAEGKKLLKCLRKAKAGESLKVRKKQKDKCQTEWLVSDTSKVDATKKSKDNFSKHKARELVKPIKHPKRVMNKSITPNAEGNDLVKREMSSISVKSLPSRRKSETSQDYAWRNNTRFLPPSGSQSQTILTNICQRRLESEKRPPGVGFKNRVLYKKGVIHKDNVDPLTWPCEKFKSATTINRTLKCGYVMQRQDNAHSGNSGSNRDENTRFEKKRGSTCGFNKSPKDICPQQELRGPLFEDNENKNVINSSISGYIRKLVFGESHSKQELANEKATSIGVGANKNEDHGDKILLNNPISTVQGIPLENCSKSGDEGAGLKDLEHINLSQKSLVDRAPSEQFLDEKMNTGSEVNSATNVLEQVSTGLCCAVDVGGSVLAKKSKKSLLSKNKHFKMIASKNRVITDQTGKGNITLQSCPREIDKTEIGKVNSSKKSIVRKRKTRKNNAPSPPILLTSIRSKASSPPKSQEIKNTGSFHSRHSLFNQGISTDTEENAFMPKKSEKKSLVKSQALRSRTSLKYTFQRAGTNIEKKDEYLSEKNATSNLKENPAEAEKLKKIASKQALNKSLETLADEEPYPGLSAKLEEKEPLIKKSKVQNVTTMGKGVRRDGKIGSLHNSNHISFSETKQSLQKLSKVDPNPQNTEPREMRSRLTNDQRLKSPKSDRELKVTPQKKVDGNNRPAPDSTIHHSASSITKEGLRSLKPARAKPKSRTTASKMFDNYKIEVKKEEVLGAVVSLVTYHPKNETEKSQKNIGHNVFERSDQSENCMYEMNKYETKIKQLVQSNSPNHISHKDGAKVLPNGDVTLLTTENFLPIASKLNSKSEDPAHSVSSDFSVEESKEKGSHKIMPFIEFDTDSESELTYTSKYGRYSLRLHNPDNVKTREDKCKTKNDDSEKNLHSPHFCLRPSVLDDVVKHLVSKEQPVKAVGPQPEGEKPPVSAKSDKRHKVTTPSFSSTSPKRIDSPKEENEMAAKSSSQSGKISKPQTTSKPQIPCARKESSKKGDYEIYDEAHKNSEPSNKKAQGLDLDVHYPDNGKMQDDGKKSKSSPRPFELQVFEATSKDVGKSKTSVDKTSPRDTVSPVRLTRAVDESIPTEFNCPPANETRRSKPSQAQRNVSYPPKIKEEKSFSPNTKNNNLRNLPRSKMIAPTSHPNKACISKIESGNPNTEANSGMKDLKSDKVSTGCVKNVNETKNLDEHIKSVCKRVTEKGEEMLKQANVDNTSKLNENVCEHAKSDAKETKLLQDGGDKFKVNKVGMKLAQALKSKKDIPLIISNKRISTATSVAHKDNLQVSLSTNRDKCERMSKSGSNVMQTQNKNSLHHVCTKTLQKKNEDHVSVISSKGDKSINDSQKGLEVQERQGDKNDGLWLKKMPEKKRNYTSIHQKLFINRTSPVKLQELDRRSSHVTCTTLLKEPKDNADISDDKSRVAYEETNTNVQHSIPQSMSGCIPTNKSQLESKKTFACKPSYDYEPEICDESSKQQEVIKKSPISLQKLEKNGGSIASQKLQVCPKSSSPGDIGSNDLMVSSPYKNEEICTLKKPTGEVGCIIGDNSSYVFGSNASFSVPSFEAACPASSKPAEPEVKVINYRLYGDRFQTYRQRKQSDDDE